MTYRSLRRYLGAVLVVTLVTPGVRAQTDTTKASDANKLASRTVEISHSLQLKAFPYVYYTPETQLAFGVGGILTFYTSEDLILRPSKLSLSGYYSTNGQYQISLTPELYFTRNRIYMSMPVSFGQNVDKFWGIGNETPETGHEEYVSQAWQLQAEVQFPPLLVHSTRVGLGYDIMNNVIVDKETNAFLLSDSVTGSNGGITSGLGFIWVWDTRDQIFFPNKGGLAEIRAFFYDSFLGSDFEFTTVEVDVRSYFSRVPDHVLAVEVFGRFAGGDPPFYYLSALGGQNRMRGYFEGRYRDRQYLTAQAEYRQYFWRRLGFVVFAGIGDVAHDLHDFTLNEFKTSYGAGLRFKFNQQEKVNLRADFGFGPGTHGIYFGLEEAF